MEYLAYILRQTGRNFKHTWATQLMTLLTVSLSVFIFSFFFIIYANAIRLGETLGDQTRLTVYLDNEPSKELLTQIKQKIVSFPQVERFDYVPREQAFVRLQERLGAEKDILNDMDPSFLPAAIEVYPYRDVLALAKLKELADHLATLPGATKVQYGQEWVEGLNYFLRLAGIIVALSGALLLLTIALMVSYSIKLAILQRQTELEVFRLLGATSASIQGPFLIEGLFLGVVGSASGLLLLSLFFDWLKGQFNVPTLLSTVDFRLFSISFTAILMAISVILCIGVSILSMRKFLRI